MARLAAVLLGLLLGACHALFPYSPASGDGSRRDVAVDGPVDRAAGDQSAEVPTAKDVRVEAVVDLGREALGPDAESLDGTLFDSGVSPTACSQPAKVGHTWSKTMKLCSYTGVAVNQCQAEGLCNTAGGWHLCTATDYLNRGGASSGTSMGWIKACIRTGGMPKAPADGLCDPTCTYGTATATDTAWICATGAPSYSLPFKHVGVRSNSMCYRVGADEPKTAGYWAPLHVAAGLPDNGAVCCTP